MRLFYSFKNWKEYSLVSVRKVIEGLLRIIYAIIVGAVSFLAYIIRTVNSFARREPKAMLVIVVLLICIAFGWSMNFVSERSKRIAAEMQRDSISLKLDSAKQNAVVCNNPRKVNHWDGL